MAKVKILAALALLLASSSALAQGTPMKGYAGLVTGQVTVAASATLVAAARSDRGSITIQNHSATDIFCDDASNVTISNGFRIPGVSGASWTAPVTTAIYCIATAGTATVSFTEIW